MGVVSRIFHDRFVLPGSRGNYFVKFHPKNGEAYEEHCRNKELHPLSILSSRIESGYMNLSPVTPESRYAVYVIIYKECSL